MGAMGRSTDSFPFGVGFFTRPWRVRQEQSACFYGCYMSGDTPKNFVVNRVCRCDPQRPAT